MQVIGNQVSNGFSIDNLLSAKKYADTERKLVIGLRIGSSMNLQYQWYYKTKTFTNPLKLILNNKDIYIMSEKAVGFDWKTQNKLTLRHSAGCSKYTD